MAQPDDLGDSYHGKLNSQLAALPHSSDKHLTRRELPHLRSENETNWDVQHEYYYFVWHTRWADTRARGVALC